MPVAQKARQFETQKNDEKTQKITHFFKKFRSVFSVFFPQNQHCGGRGRQNRTKSCIFNVFSHRPYRAHVLLDFPDPKKNQPILAFPSANLQKIIRFFKQLQNRPMAELVWVTSYWGRYCRRSGVDEQILVFQKVSFTTLLLSLVAAK